MFFRKTIFAIPERAGQADFSYLTNFFLFGAWPAQRGL
jgi:hypothetical protein